MKRYKGIFFDWDGTAVLSRSAPVDEIAGLMAPLLDQGIKLCVISGTTYEKIAGGALEKLFTPSQRQNLFLGLGRGAYNYGFDYKGNRVLLGGVLPDSKVMGDVHRVCFALHMCLFQEYGINTDIVFDRPNYCKIDLLSGVDRGNELFLQEGEAALLERLLSEKGFSGGLKKLIALAEKLGEQENLHLSTTTDAKYLEVGLSTKSDNVNFLMEKFMRESELLPQDCSFWGDEFLDIGNGIFGSDAFMRTERTKEGDFYDVSNVPGHRPPGITHLGGGVPTFLEFLRNQGKPGNYIMVPRNQTRN